MREMRPFYLPKLVASRHSSSEDAMSSSATSSDSPSCDSSQSTASDCSMPPTPTSLRCHTRYPSSSSSLASTPPVYEHYDIVNSTRTLPKLAEEPTEHQDDFVMLEDGTLAAPCLCDYNECGHRGSLTARSAVAVPYETSFDISDDFFGDDIAQISQPLRKRQKSNDSPMSQIASRLSDRLPSLSKRWGGRSTSSGFVCREIRSAASSRPPSSRSSSLTSSVLPGCEQSEIFSTVSAKNSKVNVAEPSSPIDIAHTEAEVEEPIDRALNASTPLLPPMLMVRGDDIEVVQSPLQSPTVADPSNAFSLANTPLGTPSLVPSPLLSTKPSISSFHKSKIEKIIAASDIPPLTISDPNDEWSIKLGHANFVIYPEPYIPDVCDAQSCRQLFADWEQARCNFTKHQVRTGEHFGVTSKIYQLTAEKWVEIDAEWKKNKDYTVAIAAVRNHYSVPLTPTEPAPVCQMPVLSDPKSEGKFPTLGDEDIVGPMVQIAARIQPKQSRKANFMKVLGDFSSIFFGRPSSGIRSRR